MVPTGGEESVAQSMPSVGLTSPPVAGRPKAAMTARRPAYPSMLCSRHYDWGHTAEPKGRVVVHHSGGYSVSTSHSGYDSSAQSIVMLCVQACVINGDEVTVKSTKREPVQE